MPKILITGVGGTGKSTLIQTLTARGFTAYDSDEQGPDVSRLELIKTGEPVEWPVGFVDWSKYSWNWQGDGLKKLLGSAETVFICGYMGNQADFYKLFDYIFVLSANDETIRKRRLKRTTHEHNDSSEQIEASIPHTKAITEEFIRAGGISIDSAQPVNAIADKILGYVFKR